LKVVTNLQVDRIFASFWQVDHFFESFFASWSRFLQVFLQVDRIFCKFGDRLDFANSFQNCLVTLQPTNVYAFLAIPKWESSHENVKFSEIIIRLLEQKKSKTWWRKQTVLRKDYFNWIYIWKDQPISSSSTMKC
jgi:hypothetical protein